MYLKKIEGLRTVKLKDGRLLCQTDLPPTNTQRWVASKKEVVVQAIAHGLISREDALSRYSLSEEELLGWETSFLMRGKEGLKVTRLQICRQP